MKVPNPVYSKNDIVGGIMVAPVANGKSELVAHYRPCSGVRPMAKYPLDADATAYFSEQLTAGNAAIVVIDEHLRRWESIARACAQALSGLTPKEANEYIRKEAGCEYWPEELALKMGVVLSHYKWDNAGAYRTLCLPKKSGGWAEEAMNSDSGWGYDD